MDDVQSRRLFDAEALGAEEVAGAAFAEQQFHAVGEVLDGRAIAVRGRDAGAAPLQNLRRDGIERGEVELRVAVQPPAPDGVAAPDGPVGAEEFARWGVDQKEVVAPVVEIVAVEAVPDRSAPVADFFDEDAVPQAAGSLAFRGIGGDAEPPRASAQRLAVEHPSRHVEPFEPFFRDAYFLK